jgi:hypothetical protein
MLDGGGEMADQPIVWSDFGELWRGYWGQGVENGWVFNQRDNSIPDVR